MDRPTAFSRDELLRCAHGEMFGAGNAQLPLPNMLMLDRITHIAEDGGEYDRGTLTAELDVQPDLWFFACHFAGDPVMPGCLGLDAMWQLVGFFLGWQGHPGRGRALGVGAVKFSGQVLPANSLITYQISMRRVVINRSLAVGVGDGVMSVDGREIYHAKELRVGLFPSTEGF